MSPQINPSKRPFVMELFTQLVWNGFALGSLYALYAISFFIIFGVTRIFHFAHGGVYIIGAYLVFVLYSYFLFPIVFAIIIAMAISFLIGLAIDTYIYRPLRRIGASSLTVLVSSMGLLIIIENILPIFFGHETLRLTTQLYGKVIHFPGMSITYLDIMTISISILVISFLTLFLKYTSLGKSIRAFKDNVILAEVIGVNINLVYITTFGIGSMIIVLAASLHSMDIGLNPAMGFKAVLIGAIAVIVGGMGSLPGAVLGAFLISFAQNIGVWKLSSVWQNTIAFGLLFAFIVIRPKGFFGEKMEQAEI